MGLGEHSERTKGDVGEVTTSVCATAAVSLGAKTELGRSSCPSPALRGLLV